MFSRIQPIRTDASIFCLSLALLGCAVILSSTANAATFLWLGEGADDAFTNAANWSPGTPDNDGTASLEFGESPRLEPVVDAPYSIDGITFLPTAGPYIFSGSAITIGSGGISHNDGDLQSFSNAFVLDASQTWDAQEGNLKFTGPVDLSSHTLTVSGPKRADFEGAISGTGGIRFRDGVSSNLTATNTYSGATIISQNNSGATISIDSDDAFSGNGSIAINQNGILRLASTAASSQTLSNEFTWNGGRFSNGSSPVIDIEDANDTLTLTNGIDFTSRAGIVKDGQGTLAYMPATLLTDSRWSLAIEEGLVEMNQLPVRRTSNSNSGQATGDLEFIGNSTLRVVYDAAIDATLDSVEGSPTNPSNRFRFGYGFANLRVDDDVTGIIEVESGAIFKMTGRTDSSNDFLGNNSTLVLDGADATSRFQFGTGNSGGFIDNNFVNRTIDLRGGSLSFFTTSGKSFWPQSADFTMKLNGGEFDGGTGAVSADVSLPGNLVINDNPSASNPSVRRWTVNGTGGSNSSFGNTFWAGTLEKVGGTSDRLDFDRTVSGTGTAGTVTLADGAALDIQGGIVRVSGDQDPFTDSIDATRHVDVMVGSGAQLQINRDVGIGQLAGSGTVTSTTAGTFNLLLESDTDSNFAGGINSGTGTLNLIKEGVANQTLSGASTLDGTVTINNGSLTLGDSGTLLNVSSIDVNRGDLILDNSSVNLADRLSDSAPIALSSGSGNGTLRFLGNSGVGSTETVGVVTTNIGASEIFVEPGAGQSAELTLSGLTQSSGGQVSFVAGTGTLGGGSATDPYVFITGQSNGLIGGWATVGDSFATYDSVDGVQALAVFGNDINTTVPNTNLSLSDADAASPNRTLGATFAGSEQNNIDNLRLDTTDVTLNASKTLNLQQGGLIAFGGGASTISGPGELTAGGTSASDLSVQTGAGSSLTIDASIVDNSSAAVSLAKGGDGTLILSQNNTYTGDTYINEGVLQISDQDQLGDNSSDIFFSGGTLSFSTADTINSGRTITITDGSSGTFRNTVGNGTIVLGTAGQLVGADDTLLVKEGSGYMNINQANTGFSGDTRIDNGRLVLRDVESLGASGNKGLIELNGGALYARLGTGSTSGATFDMEHDILVTGNSEINVGRRSNSANNNTISFGDLSIGSDSLSLRNRDNYSLDFGDVALTGAAIFDVRAPTEFTGSVSGNGSLRMTGNNTLTLSGADANTYTGLTQIDSGTLVLNKTTGVDAIAGDLRIGNSGGTEILRLAASEQINNQSRVTIDQGGDFDLDGFDETIGSLASTGSNGDETTREVILDGGSTLTTGGNNDTTTFFGRIRGDGNLVKAGTGTMTLTGDNTYTGDTTIQKGTLRSGSSTAFADETDMTVGAEGILDLNNFNEQIASLSGSGEVQLGSADLTVDGTTSSTFSGVISGSGGLIKDGTSTLTLAGVNTYTGDTQINGGTLLLADANLIDDASDMVLNGGEFNTGGFSDTLNSLTLSASSEIDFGDGSSVLQYGSDGSFTTGEQLTLTSWSGNLDGDGQDQLIFTTSLSQAKIDQIKFFNPQGLPAGLYDSKQLASGEIVPNFEPVPEPSTYLFGGIIVTFIGIREWRRRRKPPC